MQTDNLYPSRKPSEYWIHINIHGARSLTRESMKRLLMLIYGRIYTYMRGGFYLGEGEFIMFAVRLNDTKDLKTIKRIVTDIKKVYLKENEKVYFKVEENTNDYENGEGFLEVMNAVMNFNLLHEDNSALHLIHCMVNSFFLQPPQDENKFYKLLEEVYK